MPLFTYICEKCEFSEDIIVSYAESDDQICPKCGSKFVKQFPDSMNFTLKGDWYKNNKSY